MKISKGVLEIDSWMGLAEAQLSCLRPWVCMLLNPAKLRAVGKLTQFHSGLRSSLTFSNMCNHVTRSCPYKQTSKCLAVTACCSISVTHLRSSWTYALTPCFLASAAASSLSSFLFFLASSKEYPSPAQPVQANSPSTAFYTSVHRLTKWPACHAV